jgi:nucleotide-binding universal stress UspA family protein
MSILPTKILLATDGSEDAELAATTAKALAKITGSELHVVTLAEEYPSYDAYRPLAHRSRELAREVLDEQVKKIENLGGTIAGSHLRTGGAAEESVALAEELEAGLVVVGSRGRGRIKRLVMGSVSDSVVRHAHCPVLVVKAERGLRHYLESSISAAPKTSRSLHRQRWDPPPLPRSPGRISSRIFCVCSARNIAACAAELPPPTTATRALRHNCASMRVAA